MRNKSAVVLLCLLWVAAPVVAGSPLSFLEPFIGQWSMDPDGDFVKQDPSRRGFIVFHLEWVDPGKKTLRFVEGLPDGDLERRILDNFVTYNPRSREVVALGYQLENDYLYESTFHSIENGFVRDYKVTYPESQEFKDETDRERGWIRYRDHCSLVEGDKLHCRTEQMRAGKWQPWGPEEGFFIVRMK